MTVLKERRRRPNMRRAVMTFPSGLTLLNLFFGIFAIITASRGDFYRAGVYVIIGGICDALDGRVARATNAGSEFGEELDSLVDAISFGLAPAMIMYFAVLDREGWQWVFVFAFSACAVLRLARFNIEQAGTAKTYFQGLPSPAAGCTLASYYWFSHSWLYNYGAIGHLPWQEMLRFLMAALAALMFSPVPYPVFPRTGWRSKRALAGTVLLVTSFTLFVTNRLEFFFPLCLLYVVWGPLRWLISGLFERRQPTIPYDLSEGEDDEDDEDLELVTSQRHAPSRELRPKREELPKRSRLAEEPAAKATRTEERPPRADRPDRPERPQRTEAEIAARREKRDKRDKKEKREPREERAPRPARPEVLAVASTLPHATIETIVTAPTSSDDPMDNAGAGPELGVVATTGAAGEGTAPRKRKRRRRRGERNRTGSDPLAAQPGSTDGDSGDFDGDDGGDFGDNDAPSNAPSASERAAYESPYSPAPVAPPVEHVNSTPVVPTSTPVPTPASAPASHVEPTPSPTPPSEPHE